MPTVRWTWNPFAVWFKPQPTCADLYVLDMEKLDKEIAAAKQHVESLQSRRDSLRRRIFDYLTKDPR